MCILLVFDKFRYKSAFPFRLNAARHRFKSHMHGGDTAASGIQHICAVVIACKPIGYATHKQQTLQHNQSKTIGDHAYAPTMLATQRYLSA